MVTLEEIIDTVIEKHKDRAGESNINDTVLLKAISMKMKIMKDRIKESREG